MVSVCWLLDQFLQFPAGEVLVVPGAVSHTVCGAPRCSVSQPVVLSIAHARCFVAHARSLCAHARLCGAHALQDLVSVRLLCPSRL